MPPHSNAIEESLVPGDVAACGAERFRECAHEDVYGSGGDIKIVGYTSSVRAQSTDGVCLVYKEVKLGRMSKICACKYDKQTYFVLFLEFHDRREVDESPFHAVESLYDEKNLLPRTMSLRLTLW
jgi:hypothetical protein